MANQALAQVIRKALAGTPIAVTENVAESVQSSDTQIRSHDMLMQPVGHTGLVLTCPADTPGAEMIIDVAASLCSAIALMKKQPLTPEEAWRKLLVEDLHKDEAEALASEQRIQTDRDRCVMMLSILCAKNDRASTVLRDIIPLQERDVLVDIDHNSTALIKDLGSQSSQDELIEYANALRETVMGETALELTVSIGRRGRSLRDMAESWQEARKAAELGSLFHPNQKVYLWEHMVLERFLGEQSPEMCRLYHSFLFNRRTAMLFNEEMLTTINTFLEKDLNLSDTARQLYIHRNTLVYRLDKVQKVTGLDLRRFDDAMTFKFLLSLKTIDTRNS